MLARQRLHPARVFEPFLWLAASLVVHVPFSPLWTLTRARTPPLPRAEPPALSAEIPVDTAEQPPGESNLSPPTPPAAVAEPAAAKPAEPAEAERDSISLPPAPKPRALEPREEKVRPATVPDGAELDAGSNGPAAPSDAGVEPMDAGVSGSNPMAALGSVRSVSNTVANVRLQVETARLREHPLGTRVVALLGSIDGWRDLLRPDALNPKDIERVLVAAPSLEGSAGTVAIIEHRASSEALRAAIDRLDTPDVPRHVILPSSGVVVVALQRYLAASSYADPELGLRALEENVVASGQLEKPWRAARALALTIPRSIRWLRFRVALASGGVTIAIEAEDESPDFARRDAEALNRVASEASAERRWESGTFEAKEGFIQGTVSLSEAQCTAWLESLQPKRDPTAAPPLSATTETARLGDADPALEIEKAPEAQWRPAIATEPP